MKHNGAESQEKMTAKDAKAIKSFRVE